MTLMIGGMAARLTVALSLYGVFAVSHTLLAQGRQEAEKVVAPTATVEGTTAATLRETVHRVAANYAAVIDTDSAEAAADQSRSRGCLG